MIGRKSARVMTAGVLFDAPAGLEKLNAFGLFWMEAA